MSAFWEDDVDIDGDIFITGQLKSSATGVAPLVVASSLLVTGLNVNLLDGNHGSYYLDAQNLTNKYTTLAGWGITDAYTKIESDARYRGNSWVPTLDQVLTAGNSSAKGISLSTSHEDGVGVSVASTGLFGGLFRAGPEGVSLSFVDNVNVWGISYEGGTFATLVGALRNATNPVHVDDLVRKGYIDAALLLKYDKPTGLITDYIRGDGTYAPFPISPTGTANRITVNPTTSVVDIASTYVGQASITTLGTVTTGTWNASTIAINKGGTGLTSVGTSGQLLRSNGTGLEYFTHDFISSTLIGAANGIVPLDSSGKISSTYLPTTGMQYKGTWNASTNTPSLSDGTGVSGYYYRVDVAGTVNLGSGSITFSVGDDVIHNGSVWQRAPGGATATNLSLGAINSTTIPIVNSNGTGLTLPSATTTLAGLLSASDKVKLNSALITETDPTVPAHVKAITSTNILEWNSAKNRWISSPSETGNLNNITTGGVKTWDTSPANSPTPSGTILTFVGNSSTGDGASTNTYINQILAGTTGDWFARQSISNWSTWGATYKIWTEKHFDTTNITNWNNAASASHSAVTLSGQNYITLSGQTLTVNAVTLSGTHVTGVLPYTKGGTGLTTLGTSGQLLRSNGAALEYWTPNYLTSASLSSYYTKTESDSRYVAATSVSNQLSNNASLDLDTIAGNSVLRGEPMVNAPDSGSGAVMTWYTSERAYQLYHSHASVNGLYYRNRLTSAAGWRGWNQVASVNFVTTNTRSSSWVPAWSDITGKPTAFTPDAHTLDSHSNVTITGAAVDQVLSWSGSAWINKTLPAATVYTGSTSIVLSGTSFQRAALIGEVTAAANSNTLTIANSAVTLAKMANLAANSIIGNNTSSAAVPMALTAPQVRALLNVADGATANQTDAYLLSRANHTGTQAISTVTGLQAALDAKFGNPGGVVTQYVRGDGSLAVFPAIGNGTITFSPGPGISVGGSFSANQSTNTTVAIALDATLSDIDNVTVSGATTGQLLRFDGTNWTNWAPNYLTSFTESDPTVPAHVKAITSTNISDWSAKQAAISIASARLMGRYAAGAGAFQEISLGAGLTLSGAGVLSAAGTGGTVTSIGMTVPTGFSVSPASISTSGTFAITYSAGYTGYTTTEQTKLAAIATGATANQTDSYLLNRVNHTGAQAISTITGLQAALDGKQSAISIATARLMGRYAAGAGTFQEISLGAGLSLSGAGVLSATGTGGTVTSVGFAAPTGFSVSGSPVTGAGTLTLSYAAGYVGYTTAEQTKLAGIAAGANNYVHPNSGVTPGNYNNLTVNAQGHVTGGSNAAYLVAADLANYVTTNTDQLSIGGSKGFTGHLRISPSSTTGLGAEANGFRFTRGASGVQFSLDGPSATSVALLRGWSEGGVQFRLYEGGIQAPAAIYASGGYSYLVRNSTTGIFETRSLSTLTRGAGLTGANFDGSSAQTWAIDFGAGTDQVARGDHNHSFSGLTDTAFTSLVSGQVPQWNGTTWVNATPATGGVTSTGSAGYLSLFSGTSAIGNSALYQTGTGNIGIGTTSPANKFEIRDTEDISMLVAKTGLTGVALRATTALTGLEITGSANPFGLIVNSNHVLTINSTGLITSASHGTSANWWSAYGWGNHAGLYRPVSWAPSWTDVTGKPTTLSGYGLLTEADSRYVNATGDSMSGNLSFTNDNQGVFFYQGAAVLKRAGTGPVLRRPSTETDWQVESNDGTSRWTIWHSGNLSLSGYVPSSRSLSFQTSTPGALSLSGTPSSDLSVDRFINYSVNFGTGAGQVAEGNHTHSGYVPTGRTITINGVTQDLTSNRSWTVSGGVSGSGSSGKSVWWTSTNSISNNDNFWITGGGTFAFGSSGHNNVRVTTDGLLVQDDGGGYHSTSIFSVSSTTKGSRPFPPMSTTNWNDISSKGSGLFAWNTSENAIMWWDGIRTGIIRFNGTKYQGWTGSSWVDFH